MQDATHKIVPNIVRASENYVVFYEGQSDSLKSVFQDVGYHGGHEGFAIGLGLLELGFEFIA